MNERIKELAEQALPNIKYWNDELTKGIGAPKNRAVTVDELEKFAESIVQDCIAEVALMGVTNFENEAISWACRVIIDGIKNKFGV